MASIRVIWLIITLRLHRFPAVEKMNVRSTHDPFFDKGWKELGRNEISRVGLFILNYKYPRLERWKDPFLLLPGIMYPVFTYDFDSVVSFYRRSVTRLPYCKYWYVLEFIGEKWNRDIMDSSSAIDTHHGRTIMCQIFHLT